MTATLFGWTVNQWANAIAVKKVDPKTIDDAQELYMLCVQDGWEPSDTDIIDGVERKMDIKKATDLMIEGLIECKRSHGRW